MAIDLKAVQVRLPEDAYALKVAAARLARATTSVKMR